MNTAEQFDQSSLAYSPVFHVSEQPMTANKITFPQLAEGERCLCGTVNADGTVTHSILLPGDNDDATWQEQMDWAKSIGGDLLNRAELITAYETMPKEFQNNWYWSNTQNVSGSEYAWCQDFGYGNQYRYYRCYELRARAVRRLSI